MGTPSNQIVCFYDNPDLVEEKGPRGQGFKGPSDRL